MKKLTLTLICLMLTTGAAMAQKQFTFGPKVGVDYTHFWGKDLKNGKGLFNYQAGVFMEYRFNDKFSIAPEVVFAAQGGKWDYFDDFYKRNEKITDHINYINVPVMLKYYVCPAVSIDLGPQLGINVYSKRTEKWEESDGEHKHTSDIKDITRTIDFGVGLGLTYNIAKDVFVQGRYTLGLTKIFDGADTKNGNAQIAIGYRF